MLRSARKPATRLAEVNQSLPARLLFAACFVFAAVKGRRKSQGESERVAVVNSKVNWLLFQLPNSAKSEAWTRNEV